MRSIWIECGSSAKGPIKNEFIKYTLGMRNSPGQGLASELVVKYREYAGTSTRALYNQHLLI